MITGNIIIKPAMKKDPQNNKKLTDYFQAKNISKPPMSRIPHRSVLH